MYKYTIGKDNRIYYFKNGKRTSKQSVPNEFLHKNDELVKLDKIKEYNKIILLKTSKDYTFEMYNLPIDIIIEINKYLLFKDISNLKISCKKFNIIYNNDRIKNFEKRRYKGFLINPLYNLYILDFKYIKNKDSYTNFKKELGNSPEAYEIINYFDRYLSNKIYLYKEEWIQKKYKEFLKEKNIIKMNLINKNKIIKYINTCLLSQTFLFYLGNEQRKMCVQKYTKTIYSIVYNTIKNL